MQYAFDPLVYSFAFYLPFHLQSISRRCSLRDDFSSPRSRDEIPQKKYTFNTHICLNVIFFRRFCFTKNRCAVCPFNMPLCWFRMKKRVRMGSLFSMLLLLRMIWRTIAMKREIIIIIASRLSENAHRWIAKSRQPFHYLVDEKHFRLNNIRWLANETRTSHKNSCKRFSLRITHRFTWIKGCQRQHFVWLRYKWNRADKWNANRCTNSGRNYDCVNKTKLLQSNLVSTLNAIHSLLQGL